MRAACAAIASTQAAVSRRHPGDREHLRRPFHEDRRTRRKRLESVIEQALANNGTVLISAFSIGRTQELLYELEDIIHSKKLDAVSKGLGSRVALNLPLPSGETTAWM